MSVIRQMATRWTALTALAYLTVGAGWYGLVLTPLTDSEETYPVPTTPPLGLGSLHADTVLMGLAALGPVVGLFVAIVLLMRRPPRLTPFVVGLMPYAIALFVVVRILVS